MPDRQRGTHVVSDYESRLLKSAKIIRLIGEDRFLDAVKALEVGCGSGVICSSLAAAGGDRLAMYGVDIEDQRVEREGYTFEQFDGTRLPFPDGIFDLVISNHVIEHVGNSEAQVHHLQEIYRVLKPGGLLYLAVPNKWRLVEPHYRLPLLSWLPQSMSDWLVRATNKGRHYDCRPLSSRGLNRLFEAAAMMPEDVTLNAVHVTLDIEHKGQLVTRLVNNFLPEWLLAVSLPIIPTFIYLLKPKSP